MYIIIEIQTWSDGSVHVLTPTTESSWETAESVYHSKLSFAAASNLPCHSVTILNPDGSTRRTECYRHVQNIEE